MSATPSHVVKAIVGIADRRISALEQRVIDLEERVMELEGIVETIEDKEVLQ